MLFNFEVRVEVEDNLLVGFRGVDDPLAVLVGGVVIGVPWGGDVPSILGVQAAPTWLSCRDTEGNKALQWVLGIGRAQPVPPGHCYGWSHKGHSPGHQHLFGILIFHINLWARAIILHNKPIPFPLHLLPHLHTTFHTDQKRESC